MIDRLEELLEQVKDSGQEEEPILLGQPELVGGLTGALRRDKVEGEWTEHAGAVPPEPDRDVLSDGERDSRPERPLIEGRASFGAESALPQLYLQLVRATQSGAAQRSASVAVVRETAASANAGLTAGELDLALRRDSRRYDGGMTIY